MRLGIIARFDEGGLGSQTWEYARHLAPEAVLALSVPPPRGDEVRERLLGLTREPLFCASFPPADGGLRTWRQFAEACDVILTAETCYLRDFPTVCKAEGARLVVHANPELWEWGGMAPFTTWAPTRWLLSRLPNGTPVVPVPVDRERCAPREIGEVREILHVSSPAMLDRNGTELLQAALPYCRTSFRLLVSGPKAPPETTTVERVTVVPVGDQRDYWRLYDEGDALVLPRRYGGLCLPMQEAASRGLPVIATHVAPQIDWLGEGLGVDAAGHAGAMMKGGVTPIHACAPEALARRIDALVAGETLEAGLAASRALAEALDWNVWTSRYLELLEAP